MERLKRLWAFWFGRLGDLQTVLGIPQAWQAVSYGAGAVIASMTELAFHWKVLVFLVTANLILWGVVGVYALNVERWQRIRRLRGILAAAADSLDASTGNRPMSMNEAFNRAFDGLKIDTLINMACHHTVVADYDDFVTVEKNRAERQKRDWNAAPVKAAYLRRLSRSIGVAQVNHDFDVPRDLATLLKQDWFEGA